MLKYKFLNILDSLSDADFRKFGKFLHSPFFNESRNLLKLYEYLVKYFLSHSLEKITLKMIYENVYESSEYDDVKTRKLLSDFTFQLEQFLMHSSLEADIVTGRMLLAREFRRKMPGKFLISELRDLNKNLYEDSHDSINYYITKFRLADEELTTKKHIIHRNIQLENIRDLMNSSRKLDLYTKLYSYHILIQHNIQDDIEFTQPGFESLRDFLVGAGRILNTGDAGDRGMYLLYYILTLIEKREVENIYYLAEQYISDNKAFLKIPDIEFVMYTIINFYVNEINRGRYENLSHFIEIFKKIDKKGYIDNLFEINHITFVEIVHFSVLLKENQFAESVIWKFFSKINAYYKVDSLNLAIAVLRYGQGRIGEVRTQLEKLKYRSYGFYLIAKSLLLKIYFEENSLKYIYPLADSFKHYIKRNKTIPAYFAESFSLFLNYLTKLTSVKMGNMKDVARIEFNILNEKNFYGKEWLLDKASRLTIEA